MAALMAPIDRVKAIVRPSIVGSRTVGVGGVGGVAGGSRTGEHGGCGPTGQDQAWIVIVTAPSRTARTTRASRQPMASCTAAIVGWKMVEANPATKVRVVIALVARAPNCLISTTWAGS